MPSLTLEQQLQARIAELELQAANMRAAFDSELADHKAKYEELGEKLLKTIDKVAEPGSRGTRSKVNKPDRYDGSIEKYHKFINELEIVFEADPGHYEDRTFGDHRKIIYALSLLKDGRAAQWSRIFLKKYRAEGGSKSYTWAKFEHELSIVFADHNPTATAVAKLKNLSMAGRTAEDYIMDFEIYEQETKYNDYALIDILKHGLHDRLVARIYDLPEMPTTLSEWKDWARKLDRQFREHRDERRGSRTVAASGNPPPPPAPCAPPMQPVRPAHMATDRRDGTGTTFGGVGQAMDIDAARRAGVCYHCHKPGHISGFCPDKRVNIRQLAAALSKADLEALQKELQEREEHQPDFVEGRE